MKQRNFFKDLIENTTTLKLSFNCNNSYPRFYYEILLKYTIFIVFLTGRESADPLYKFTNKKYLHKKKSTLS